MIFDEMISMFLIPIKYLLDFLPDVPFGLDTAFIDNILFIFRAVGYFLPMQTVGLLFSLCVSITIFKIIISFIRTLWNLIPLL